MKSRLTLNVWPQPSQFWGNAMKYRGTTPFHPVSHSDLCACFLFPPFPIVNLAFPFPGSFNLDSNRHKPKENIRISLTATEMSLEILDKGREIQVPFSAHLHRAVQHHCVFLSEKLQALGCLLKYVRRSARPFPFLPPHTECICEL